MSESKMNFFEKLFNSVATPKLYPKMVRKGVGKAFLYLFLFSLIFGTISAVIVWYEVTKEIEGFSELVKADLPEFTLSQGQLHVEGDMPIVLEETATSLIMIDVSGNTTREILDNYETGVLVLKDRVINKENSVETTEFNFSTINFDLNKDMVLTWLPFLQWLGVIAGVFIFIFFFIGKMISALSVSILGLLISLIQKAKTPFGQLYSIAIYALTLPSIIKVISSLSAVSFPWYIYYGITLVYMWLAIKNLTIDPTIEETEGSAGLTEK
jgi:hypothetical protein